MEYIDEILDRINSEGIESVFYDLYCENNMLKLSNFNLDDFEEIYFALFDEDVSSLEKASRFLELANNGEFEERIDIIYYEILDTAFEKYSFKDFIANNPRETWNKIMDEHIKMKAFNKQELVFHFYKVLQKNPALKTF